VIINESEAITLDLIEAEGLIAAKFKTVTNEYGVRIDPIFTHVQHRTLDNPLQFFFGVRLIEKHNAN
jgi:hypothetical protein